MKKKTEQNKIKLKNTHTHSAKKQRKFKIILGIPIRSDLISSCLKVDYASKLMHSK